MAYTSADEVKASHDILHATYKSGITKSLKWRKWQLKQFWWMLNDNEDALLHALHQDLNRHPFEGVTTDLAGVKGEILHMLRNLEKWARGEAPVDAGFVMGTLGGAWLRKEPLGVCLIIGAWNFPIYTLLCPAVGAVAAGNCILFKPSEQAPATQKLLETLLHQYLDTSAIRIATGGAQETALILQHKFNHIFYTGGGKVGRIVATAAAKHLTPVVLELGGQAPGIVTKTANVDIAAKRIAHAKLANGGQICINVNHVFVDPTVHDEFVRRVIHWTRSFVAAGTDHLAHIITDQHYNRISNLLSKTQGTIAYTGDHDPSTKFLHPTVVTDVTPDDSLMSEELFASMMPIIRCDLASAVSTINSMPHPLGLYIFSSSQAEISQILDNTTSGGVTINDVMIHTSVPNAPFGGVGESGYGSYHGKYGFDAFSHTRTVVTMPMWMERVMGWRYAPFKMENRKVIEGSLKAGFKRGEGLEDQKIGGQNTVSKAMGTLVVAAVVVAAFDAASGNRVGLVRKLSEMVRMSAV